MAVERTVPVTLRANIGQYVSSMRTASNETAKFAKDGAKQLAEHNRQIERVGKGALIAGGLIAVGIGAAVKSYMEFDKQMSNVRAVSNASAGEMKALSAAAVDAGARTKFSASEAAQATGELAKVGLGAKDILGGALNGALDLAAAGNLQLADAAMYAGQTMKIFKLEGKDVPRIADALANGANKSAADVTDMAQALQQAGLQSAQMGLGLEDTVGTLSLFADNALMGSDAGTSFKTMLARLNPSTDEASAAMEDLGLKFFDANGDFIGIEASAGMLQSRLKGLSVEQRQSALNTIFGSDAIRAATVLYDAGASGVKRYVDGVSEQGAAARLAAIQMDNLSGDVEQLQGAFETALIQSGSGANDMLRGIVQSVSAGVEWFSQLPGPVQAGATALAAVAGSGSLAVGAFLTLVPKVAEARKALESLGGVSRVLTPVGIALAAATVAIGFFIKGQMDAQQRAAEFRATLDQQTGAITENTRAFIANSLQQRTFAEDGNGAAQNVLDLAKSVGVSSKTVIDASLGQADALSRVQQAAQEADTAYQNMIASNLAGQPVDLAAFDAAEQRSQGLNHLLGIIRETTDEYGTQIDAQEQVAEAIGTTNGATGNAAQKTAELAAKQAEATRAAQDQAKAIDDLRKSVQDYGSATSDLIGTQIGYEEAIDRAAEAVKKNGKATKLSTDAGRENTRALLEVADAAKAQAVQMNVSGQSVDKVRTYMVGKDGKGGARQAFIDMAVRMGRSTTDAGRLADQLGLTTANVNTLSGAVKKVPEKKSTKVEVPTKKPMGDIADIRAQMATLRDKSIYIRIGSNISAIAAQASAAFSSIQALARTAVGGTKKATGGAVFGEGTGTSDSIPAWLSNGEHVLTAAEVQKAGGHAAIYRMRKAISTEGLRFRDGGAVGVQSFASGGAVNAPLGQFFSDYMASLGQTITREMIAELRASVTKAQNELKANFRDRDKHRADSSYTLGRDRAAIADAQADVRHAKSKAARAAAQKRLDAAEAKYEKDRRAAAAQAVKDNEKIAASKDKITAAQNKLTAAQAAQKVQSESALTRFGKANAAGIKNTGAFIANIEKIASRGYVTLAQQLAAMSNEEAETIAAQAAVASTATLDALSKQVTTAQTQQAQLDNIQGITTIFGAVSRGNFSLTDIARQSGMSLDDIIAAAQLIAGDLKGNKNAAKIIADLAELAKNGALGVGWYESGGYTGNGGTSTPAGFVHGQEYVFDAATTARFGVQYLDAMRAGRLVPAMPSAARAVDGTAGVVAAMLTRLDRLDDVLSDLPAVTGAAVGRGASSGVTSGIAAAAAVIKQQDRQREGVSR